MPLLLAVVFGAVTGLDLGLLGAGGPILAVTALVYGVGEPLGAQPLETFTTMIDRAAENA